MKVSKELIVLAANCGIDARGMAVLQLKEAHNKQLVGVRFLDQHDARLTEALEKEKRKQ